MGNTFANPTPNKQLLHSTLNTQHSTPTMKSMIALLVVLVLAVCQIDAYPQPIFFPGGSGAGFVEETPVPSVLLPLESAFQMPTMGASLLDLETASVLPVPLDTTPVGMETVSPMADKYS